MSWLHRLTTIARAEINLYSASVTNEKLYRHHRVARTCGWVWLAAGGLMASSVVEIMLSKGWLQMVWIALGLGSMLVCTVMIIPGIAADLWIQEIDRSLLARGLPVPRAAEMVTQKRAQRGAMKMVVYFVLAVLAASLVNAGLFHK